MHDLLVDPELALPRRSVALFGTIPRDEFQDDHRGEKLLPQDVGATRLPFQPRRHHTCVEYRNALAAAIAAAGPTGSHRHPSASDQATILRFSWPIPRSVLISLDRDVCPILIPHSFARIKP